LDKNDKELFETADKEDLMMSSETFNEEKVPAKRLEDYLDLVCRSSLIYGSSNNLELGLHVLNYFKGDFKEAIKSLLNQTIGVPETHPITTYKYSETDLWTQEEIKRFEAAILKHDKVFGEIADEVETKSIKQCVEFYYLWKKVMSDGARKKWRLVKKHRYVNNEAVADEEEEKKEKKETEGNGGVGGGGVSGAPNENISNGKTKSNGNEKTPAQSATTSRNSTPSPMHMQGVKLECAQCNIVIYS
jgi:hypothetical protein